jgi:RHS repeat-associated protein
MPDYLFNAKELDEENGMYYYSARYYNPPVFISRDPLFEKYPFMSPYAYCSNNPINRVDPTGMSDSPIYDLDGNFLGTDDEGLKGDAIVMKRSDFKQGMSHEDAISKSANLNYNNREEAEMKMNTHYSGLKNRPDYDGKLTLSEANDWYRNGSGQPLFVDAFQIDLYPVKKSDFTKVEESFYMNFAFTSNKETGLVYGNIKLTLLNNDGDVRLGFPNGLLDVYDFDYKSGIKNMPRNIATWIGHQKAGRGIGFNIYTYGTSNIK